MKKRVPLYSYHGQIVDNATYFETSFAAIFRLEPLEIPFIIKEEPAEEPEALNPEPMLPTLREPMLREPMLPEPVFLSEQSVVLEPGLSRRRMVGKKKVHMKPPPYDQTFRNVQIRTNPVVHHVATRPSTRESVVILSSIPPINSTNPANPVVAAVVAASINPAINPAESASQSVVKLEEIVEKIGKK